MIQGINDYATAAKYLKDIYRLINEEYFRNKLPDVTITIQKKAGTFGHFSLDKLWDTGHDHQHEINISASYLNRPIVAVVCTLLHEACHLYAFMNGIADVSKNGVYHTKKFKDIAEARDLKIGQHKTYGWTITEPTDKLVQWVEKHGLIDISLYRADSSVGDGDGATGVDGIPRGGNAGGLKAPKKKGSTRKYQCPVCGLSVRATKEVYLICGNDMVPLITEE
ncbi:MAG: SprT-like domain-containing protein [Anaerocolumna sp.]